MFLLTSLFLQGVCVGGGEGGVREGWGGEGREEMAYIWRGGEWVGGKVGMWVLGGRWVVRCAGVIGVLRGRHAEE